MSQAAIGRYGPSDYRLVWWDGSSTTELATWDHKPDEPGKIAGAVAFYDLSLNLEEAIEVICRIAADHQGTINKEAGHPWPWE